MGLVRIGGSAWREADWTGPEGYVPRTLFDNFIGRKRDVDGGVLAGLIEAKALERPKRLADGHVSDNHSGWSWFASTS